MTTDTSAFSFNKQNNGLCVCEFGNDRTLAISTVNNNESKFTNIERQIRAVKEGVRSALARLCFDCCDLLFKYLVAFTVSRMNMFPDSTRTDNLSAFSVLYNRIVNARTDCHLEFGAQYEVTLRSTNNTIEPRTVSAISIAQTPNGKGTCQFYNLAIRGIFHPTHFLQVPMTDATISHLNSLAAMDKRPPSRDPTFTLNGQEVGNPDKPTTAPPPAPRPPADDIPFSDPQAFPPITDSALDPSTEIAPGALSRADSLSIPSHTDESRGEPGRTTEESAAEEEADTAMLPIIEETPDLPPALIDEEGDEATPTTRPPLEINSRPQRTRKAPDRLNLAVI